MSAAAAACAVDPARRARQAEAYTALHEGLPPAEFLCEWVPDAPGGPTHALGVATEVQYRKATPPKDGEDDGDETDWLDFARYLGPEGPRRSEYSYHHPWAAQARPTLRVEPGGGEDGGDQLWILTGRYETTRRGIEDRVTPGMKTEPYLHQPHVQPERMPGRATELTTLGRLEWIKYKYPTPSGWREAYLAWPPATAPLLAHDQHGNLRVLHGRYAITERGVEDIMAKRKSSNRSSRRRSTAGVRSNPSAAASRGRASAYSGSESGSQRAWRMILNSAVVGGVAAATGIGMNMLLGNVAWDPGVKAATKIGVGLLGGLGLAFALPTVPSIPAGFAIGGVASGFVDLWYLYVAPRLGLAAAPIIAPVATTTTTSSTTTTVTPPAGQARLPGGMPQGYTGVSPQACAVPRAA